MSAVEEDPEHLVRWCRPQGIRRDRQHVPVPRDLRPLPRRAARRHARAGRLLADPAARRGRRPHRRRARPTSPRSPPGRCSPPTPSCWRSATRRRGGRAASTWPTTGSSPTRGRPAWSTGSARTTGCCWSAPGSPPSTSPCRSPRRGRRARLTAMSRHGLLPLRHLPEPPGPAAAFDGRDVRCARRSPRSAAGSPTRRRLALPGRVGQGRRQRPLGRADPRRSASGSLRHVGRRWEIARHRMAPAMAAVVDDLLATGRLRSSPPTRRASTRRRTTWS